MESADAPQVHAPAAARAGGQVGAMSTSFVRVNGVGVATDSSKPTVLNINVNRPSGLSILLDIVKSQWKGCTTPSRTYIGEQKVLGFIVTGAVAVLSERRPNCLWCTAAFLLHLASLGVAIAGLVFVSGDLRPDSWMNRWPLDPEVLCKPPYYDYRRYGEFPAPEPDDYRAIKCNAEVKKFLNILRGVQVIVLVSTCLALCISLYSLVSGIKGLCCTCARQQEEEEPTVGQGSEQLMVAEAAPYAEKCSKM
ncbi:transmembrane protein 176B-like isoform X3 [Pleurodeles waltl]|uniref:transmembrane protein 176B-like isoform X3 n=1 Tax=Pleurodeles waltl TaxID=8319 RepID=UPI0037099996